MKLGLGLYRHRLAYALGTIRACLDEAEPRALPA